MASIEERLNDPVTKHMRRDFATLALSQSVAEALTTVRSNPPTGRIVYFYVVDETNRLCGVVPTRRLLLSDHAQKISKIMVEKVVKIPSTATVLDACEFFTLHRLLAFPVVDDEQKILGVVDVELYTDELNDTDGRLGGDQLFQLIGVHLTDAQQSSPVSAFRLRFPWLLANIVGGIMAAFLSGQFENELRKTVALALFIPVVLALAESVSIQSVSLSLQALRGRHTNLAEVLRKLRIELFTGFYLGLACAVSVAIVALFWLGQWLVVLCLLGGIAGGVTFAAVIGVAMPNVLRLFQRDPQVAAGPVALAAADIVTLLIYFGLARILLS